MATRRPKRIRGTNTVDVVSKEIEHRRKEEVEVSGNERGRSDSLRPNSGEPEVLEAIPKLWAASCQITTETHNEKITGLLKGLRHPWDNNHSFCRNKKSSTESRDDHQSSSLNTVKTMKSRVSKQKHAEKTTNTNIAKKETSQHFIKFI